MLKEEVEQILIIVKSGQADALNMKIYKNGIICRHGCGGLPRIGISAMSFTENPAVFNRLMESVPEEILSKPVNYQDEKIETPLEYIIAFFGVSKNGETGESAEWTKSTGIRLLIDTNTNFRHPILNFADTFSVNAAEYTNSWYFDIIVKAVYKLQSTILPQNTMLAVPKTEKEIQNDFENYVNQIRFSGRQWDLQGFAKDKIYLDANSNRFMPHIIQNDKEFNLSFIKLNEQVQVKSIESDTKKRWWKFW